LQQKVFGFEKMKVEAVHFLQVEAKN